MESVVKILSEYTFDIDMESVGADLICVLCKKLIGDSVVSNVCGCGYCYKCLDEFCKEQIKYCPGQKEYCRDEPIVLGSNAFRSVMLNKKISKVKVDCPNRSCPCNIELCEVADHLRLCSKQPMDCPFVTLGCGNDRGDREAIMSHLNMDTLTHSELLIELMENMRNEIGVLKDGLKEIKLENEILGEELQKVKNSMVITLKEQSETMEAEINRLKQNIERLMTEMDDVKMESENSKIEIVSLKEESQKNENRIVSLEVQLREVKVDDTRDRDMDNERREKMEVVMDGLRKEVDTMREDRERVDVLRKEMDTVTVDRKKHDAERLKRIIYWIKCNKLCPNIYGDFIWKIDQWSKKINTEMNTSLFSESFYANNYKLCLRIYICGGDNVYLWCYVMRGDNDDEVAWPMRHKVTLGIINQHTLEAYFSHTFTYDTNGRGSVFDRPTKDRNDCAIGSLSPFVRYSAIKDVTAIVANDSIVVSCVITDP